MIGRIQRTLPSVNTHLNIEKGQAANIGSLSYLAGQLINVGTSACLIGYGIKEILLDCHPTWFRITPNPNSPPTIKKTVEAVDWLLMMVRNQPSNTADKVRFTLHGLLMIGTGTAGSASALARLGWLSIGPALPFLDFTAGALFILGNLIYMEYNIEKFIDATKQINSTTNKTIPRLQQIAATIGIISNLAYIATSVTSLTTLPFYYALTLGLVGLLTGSFRILLESYIVYKATSSGEATKAT